MQLAEAVTPFQATLAAQRREREARYATAAAKLRLDAQAKAEKEAKERREREAKYLAEYEAQKARALEQYGWADIPSPSVRCIIEITGRHFGVAPLDIVSRRRTAVVVLPRQVAMYLAKSMTPKSLPEIGRCVGGRDHTTALHSVRKIAALLKSDETIKAHVEAIAAKIEAARPAPGLSDAAA